MAPKAPRKDRVTTCQLCGRTYSARTTAHHVGVVVLHYLDWKDTYRFQMDGACLNDQLHSGNDLVIAACGMDRFYDRELLNAVKKVMSALKNDGADNSIVLQYTAQNREWILEFAETLKQQGYSVTTKQKDRSGS